jgi:hypothetical protein
MRRERRNLTWTNKAPTKEGWYDTETTTERPSSFTFSIHAGTATTKAWDWDQGRLMLCSIAGYEGEWFGPLEVPK